MAHGVYYILDKDHNIIETPSVMEWGKCFSSPGHIVGRDEINGRRISTVFLGIDHGWDNGPPVLFETMIFTDNPAIDPLDQYQERCCTWDEAVAMHKRACARALNETFDATETKSDD